jgi:hypothetical protein
MKVLVGDTGLIGTTLKYSVSFDLLFNSKNISTFDKLVKDGAELYLSCLPAAKWLVNKNLNGDLDNILNIVEIIAKKKYTKVILFSTIDIYGDSPIKSNEDYSPNISKLSYGTNRYLFELLIRERLTTDGLNIFRLPALFSKNIKKNILYDLIHNNNIDKININSTYQWYNLDSLYSDIEEYNEKYVNETTFNLFTEPIPTLELIKLFPSVKISDLTYGEPLVYDYTSKFGDYIHKQDKILNEIKQLVHEIRYK